MCIDLPRPIMLLAEIGVAFFINALFSVMVFDGG